MLGTFLDTFFKMATDIILHRFWVDVDSISGCFLVLKSEKTETKNTIKTYLQKSHETDLDQSREIREWILWSCKTIQGSQIPGLGT